LLVPFASQGAGVPAGGSAVLRTLDCFVGRLSPPPPGGRPVFFLFFRGLQIPGAADAYADADVESRDAGSPSPRALRIAGRGSEVPMSDVPPVLGCTRWVGCSSRGVYMCLYSAYSAWESFSCVVWPQLPSA
jgi:hypothetical protein